MAINRIIIIKTGFFFTVRVYSSLKCQAGKTSDQTNDTAIFGDIYINN